MIKNDFLYSAKSEQEIKEWAKARHGYHHHTNLDVNGRKIFIVFEDVGSGTYIWNIYLYVFRQEEWNLSLVSFHITNDSDVQIEIDKKTNQLIFKSKTGKVLLLQSLDSIQLKYDQIEKKE